MVKLFFICVILISSMAFVSCQGGVAKPTDETCEYFHIGTFKYVGNEDIRIERTETKQIEYNLDGTDGYVYTDYYSIVWENPCTYYLLLDSTDHKMDLEFTKTDTMWTTITNISRTGYAFTAVKGDMIYQGQLKKTAP